MLYSNRKFQSMAIEDTSATLQLLYRISRELANSLDLQPTLQRILSLSLENVGAERGTLIALNNRQVPAGAAQVYHGRKVSFTRERLQATLDHGLAGWVVRSRQSVLIPDTSQDERWVSLPATEGWVPGPRAALCVPLLAREQLAGVLTIVHPQTGFFNNGHLNLAQAIADLAGMAINNALLVDSLQSANHRYRVLFEDSIDPILVTDWEGHILEANRQSVLFSGLAPSELLQGNIFKILKGSQQVISDAAERLGKGAGTTYPDRIEVPDAPARHVEVHIRRIDIDGRPMLQWMLNHISERRELDTLREDMIAMLYHDMRSPLANIISSIEILTMLAPEQTNPGMQPVVNIARRSAERLQRLIDSMLDINRIESGQSLTSQRLANAAILVNEAVETVQAYLTARNHTLKVNVPASLPPIYVDTDMIRRVLINLLENAAKFSLPGGEIQVDAGMTDSMVSFQVKDNGPGIPLENQEAIFEKFVRTRQKDDPRGLGLGLAFCRLAVTAHGGKIRVESQEGEGSIFIFTIPIAPPE